MRRTPRHDYLEEREKGRRLGFSSKFLFLTQIAQVSSCKIFEIQRNDEGERGIGGMAPGLSEALLRGGSETIGGQEEEWDG